jgi:hypothetical protein
MKNKSKSAIVTIVLLWAIVAFFIYKKDGMELDSMGRKVLFFVSPQDGGDFLNISVDGEVCVSLFLKELGGEILHLYPKSEKAFVSVANRDKIIVSDGVNTWFSKIEADNPSWGKIESPNFEARVVE